MYTKQQLIEQLAQMNISHSATLLVHSSMKAIGEVEGGAETVLDAFCEYLSSGLLLMPTHSWHIISNDNAVFDPSTTPSCTGILGQLLLKREGAVRSLHPTHSLAVWGKGADAFVRGEHLCQTPCGRNGCIGKLLDRGGLVLMVGCPMSKCTFIHGVEEWNGIENRLGEPEVRYIIMPNGEMYFGAMCPHRAPVPDVSLNYAKLEKPFLELGVAVEGQLGSARCLLCDCEDMVRVTSEFLICRPDLFLDDKPVERSIVDELKRLEEI